MRSCSRGNFTLKNPSQKTLSCSSFGVFFVQLYYSYKIWGDSVSNHTYGEGSAYLWGWFFLRLGAAVLTIGDGLLPYVLGAYLLGPGSVRKTAEIQGNANHIL